MAAPPGGCDQLKVTENGSAEAVRPAGGSRLGDGAAVGAAAGGAFDDPRLNAITAPTAPASASATATATIATARRLPGGGGGGTSSIGAVEAGHALGVATSPARPALGGVPSAPPGGPDGQNADHPVVSASSSGGARSSPASSSDGGPGPSSASSPMVISPLAPGCEAERPGCTTPRMALPGSGGRGAILNTLSISRWPFQGHPGRFLPLCPATGRGGGRFGAEEE